MKFLFMLWLLAAVTIIKSDNVPHSQDNLSGGQQHFKPNTDYAYDVDARTLTALGVSGGGDAASSEWAGVHLTGKLYLRVQSQGRIWGQLTNAVYSHVHQELPGGWSSPLTQGQAQSYPAIQRPFEVRMNGGLVKELIVSKDTGVQEENLIKGLLGALQMDLSGKNLQNKDSSFYDARKGNGVFRRMETDVTGTCGTLYTVAPLPADFLQQMPEYAPLVQPSQLAKNAQNLLHITKTKDYSDCDKRVSYNSRVPEGLEWEKTAHSTDNFMARVTVSTIVADRSNNEIQSASVINKVKASPMLYTEDKAMVVSSVRLTLVSVNRSSGPAKSIQSPRSAGSLIYSVSAHHQTSDDQDDSSDFSSEEDFQQQSHYGKNSPSDQQRQEQSQQGKRRVRRHVLDRHPEGCEDQSHGHGPSQHSDHGSGSHRMPDHHDEQSHHSRNGRPHGERNHEHDFDEERHKHQEEDRKRGQNQHQHRPNYKDNAHIDMEFDGNMENMPSADGKEHNSGKINNMNRRPSGHHGSMKTGDKKQDYDINEHDAENRGGWPSGQNKRRQPGQGKQTGSDDDESNRRMRRPGQSIHFKPGRHTDEDLEPYPVDLESEKMPHEDKEHIDNVDRNGKYDNDKKESNQRQWGADGEDKIHGGDENERKSGSFSRPDQQNHDDNNDDSNIDHDQDWHRSNDQQQYKPMGWNANSHKDKHSRQPSSPGHVDYENNYDWQPSKDGEHSEPGRHSDSDRNPSQHGRKPSQNRRPSKNEQPNAHGIWKDGKFTEQEPRQPSEHDHEESEKLNEGNGRNAQWKNPKGDYQPGQENDYDWNQGSPDDWNIDPSRMPNKRMPGRNQHHRQQPSDRKQGHKQHDNDDFNYEDYQHSRPKNQNNDMDNEDRWNDKYGKDQRKPNERFDHGTQNQWEGRKNHANKNNKNNRYNPSYSDSDSSVSSDKWENVPNMYDVPINNIFVAPEERQKLQSVRVEDLVRVTNQIANDLRGENQASEKGAVAKLSELVNIVAQMNSQQLQQATNKIRTPNNAGNLAWELFRDAVVESGTAPAFTQIKKWILTKQIQYEEAAQVIAHFPKTLRTPTNQIIEGLFDLSISKEVMDQRVLNSTAKLASTTLINQACVDTELAHHKYASHLFGKFPCQNDEMIINKVLPVLKDHLRKAIEMHDSHKAQVDIEAIGKLGHLSILKVFAPYLEGEYEASTFLRTHMVQNLETLAKLYPKESRNVLFGIYNNEGEKYEVRVAAIFKLFRADPTTAMLLQMAAATHNDPSLEVRSAIQSGIMYASELEQEEHKDLARRAQQAAEVMNQERLGDQYSKAVFDDFQDDDMNLGYDQSYFHIGSMDSILPKSFAYQWISKIGGWMEPTKVQSAVSSVHQMVDMVRYQLNKGNAQKQSAQSTDSNKQNNRQEPLEANLFVKLFNQERFFAVGPDAFEQLPEMIRNVYSHLSNGKNFNYTKFYNAEKSVIMFPLAMGVPSYITYTAPTLLRANGNVEVKAQSQRTNIRSFQVSKVMNATGQVDLLYSSNFEGKIGFVNTLNKELQYITAGVVRKERVNIPFKFDFGIDFENTDIRIELSPLYPKRDTDIYELSVTPFTSIAEKNSLQPVLERPQTKLARRQHPRVQRRNTYGSETGMQFTAEYEYDNVQDASEWYERFYENFLDAIVHYNAKRNTEYGSYTLRHNADKSVSQKMVFTLDYDNNDEQRQGKQWGSIAKVSEFLAVNYPSDVSINSEHRQEELLQEVSFGIKSSRASLLDFGVEFVGPKKAQYAMTVAIGHSLADEKVQMIFFYNQNSAANKQYQIHSAVQVKRPNVPITDYQKALNFQAYSDLQGIIKYGENAMSGSQISVQGKMNQSPERMQYLRNSPIGKQCEQQMKEGNNMLPACISASLRANIMNNLYLNLQYNNIGNFEKNITYRAYRWFNQWHEYPVEEQWEVKGKEKTVEFNMNLYPDLNSLNFSISAPIVHIEVNDVPVGRIGKAIFALHPSKDIYHRLIQSNTKYDAIPNCVVDKNQINTYGNTTYPYAVRNCWHVAMQSDSNEGCSYQQATVLVRENNGHKEALVRYRTEQGIQVNVEFNKDKVVVNGNPLALSKDQVAEVWDKPSNTVLVAGYSLASGETIIEVDNNNLRLVTDGDRIFMQAGDSFRNRTRGLCGRMGNEPQFDLETAESCYMSDDRQFAARWALTKDQCEQEVQDLYQKAQKATCLPYRQQYPTVHSNGQFQESSNHKTWGYSMQSRFSKQPRTPKPFVDTKVPIIPKTVDVKSSPSIVTSGKTSTGHKSKPCPVEKRVQILPNQGQTCISEIKLPKCPDNCKAVTTTELPVNVLCRPANDLIFKGLIQHHINANILPFELGLTSAKAVLKQQFPSTCEYVH